MILTYAKIKPKFIAQEVELKFQNQANGNPTKEFLELTYIEMVVKKTLVDYYKAMKD